jgi:hypothetical protein
MEIKSSNCHAAWASFCIAVIPPHENSRVDDAPVIERIAYVGYRTDNIVRSSIQNAMQAI